MQIFGEQGYAGINFATGSVKPGDAIRVLVLKASVEDKRIDFKPVFSDADRAKKSMDAASRKIQS